MLPKHKNTTLPLDCLSSHFKHCSASSPRRSFVAINGPMQKIGGVGPSGTQSPLDIVSKALGSSELNELTMIPEDFGKWVAKFTIHE